MFRILSLLAAAVLLFSCQVEEVDPLEGVDEGAFKGSKDGVSFTSTNVSAAMKDESIRLTAYGDEDEYVVIEFLPIIGDHSTSGSTNYRITYNDGTNTYNSYYEDNGTLSITAIEGDSGFVTGSFSFTYEYTTSTGGSSSFTIDGAFNKVEYDEPLAETFSNSVSVYRNGAYSSFSGNEVYTYGGSSYIRFEVDFSSSYNVDRELSLYFNPLIGVGTHSIVSYDENFWTYPAVDFDNYNYNSTTVVPNYDRFTVSTPGTLTITFHDVEEKVIEGSFSVSGTSVDDNGGLSDSEEKFTSGKFKFSY